MPDDRISVAGDSAPCGLHLDTAVECGFETPDPPAVPALNRLAEALAGVDRCGSRTSAGHANVEAVGLTLGFEESPLKPAVDVTEAIVTAIQGLRERDRHSLLCWQVLWQRGRPRTNPVGEPSPAV